MASDVMAVRLHLPQVRVLEVVEDTAACLVVGVESTLRRLRCPDCGFKSRLPDCCDVSRHRNIVDPRDGRC